MVTQDLFIRNLEADSYRENFLISAVLSIFIIRIFLKLTHYPHLGSGSFHIAHILWGGFFMMVALIILLSFLSQKTAVIASILGGIGFGAFIDELGKFITSDNNYFFQPTIALIYIVFVLLFLILRFIPRYRAVTQREYLVNALEMIKESAINDFDEEEEKRAVAYLRKCDPKNPIVKALKQLLTQLEVEDTPPPGIFSRLRYGLRQRYYAIAQSGFVINVVIIFLTFQTLYTVAKIGMFYFLRPVLSFSDLGQLYSSLLAGIFVLIGLSALRFSRVEAYRFFRISILITILLTEFFVLMHQQWYEVVGLAINVFTLLIINYAMYRDEEKLKLTKLAPPTLAK
ncbi:MAG: hypothetical protein ACR2LN_04060 [Candidatus Levyibacteriota bacterium]